MTAHQQPVGGEVAHLPAEEALYLGSALAHVVAYREQQRANRIREQNHRILSNWMDRIREERERAGLRTLLDMENDDDA